MFPLWHGSHHHLTGPQWLRRASIRDWSIDGDVLRAASRCPWVRHCRDVQNAKLEFHQASGVHTDPDRARHWCLAARV